MLYVNSILLIELLLIVISTPDSFEGVDDPICVNGINAVIIKIHIIKNDWIFIMVLVDLFIFLFIFIPYFEYYYSVYLF